MRVIEFWESCTPPRTGKKNSKGAFIDKKSGKARVFNRSNSDQAESDWHDILKAHQPEKPLEGVLKLRIDLYFALIGSDTNTKANRERAEYGVTYWMPTRPDAGNLGEAVQDVMTKLLYFKDDSQVCDLRITKHRSSSPGVKIRLEEVGE